MRVVCIRNCSPCPQLGVPVAPSIGDECTVLDIHECMKNCYNEPGMGYDLEEFPMPFGFTWNAEYFVEIDEPITPVYEQQEDLYQRH